MKVTLKKYYNKLLLLFIILLGAIQLFYSCNHKEKINNSGIFRVLGSEQTGISFNNKLTPTSSFSMFNYMYFYNGAGLGTGDFNNDGYIDLFFASNQGRNSLYLNKGNLKFEDVTTAAKIPDDHAWSTGVSVVDINNDGLLDIYVCRVGKYEILNSQNQFFICQGVDENGVPFYEDRAKEYGLDFSGFSTQAVFFDFDLDGDLDMFLLNHAVHQNGVFAARQNFIGTYDPLSGDRLFRNNGNSFTDITKSAGINSSKISYGLGIAVADINLDGWPDIYTGNDFHENDYLYINQKNGTFKEIATESLMHTSKFSMGVDIADVNNDGFDEIISMDMLPYDPYILKRSLGDDEYDIFNQKIAAGYSYQYARNNLQYNRRNGVFSETGAYSGIYATDWSWAPLFFDFDNDGLKDLFISNGIPKRLNDMDYINFISNNEIQEKILLNQTDDKNLALTNKLPEIKIPNRFFNNKGDLVFNDISDQIGNNITTYSNGAIYADLDNDGDLDVVVNNIDNSALIYENRSNNDKEKPGISIKLSGSNNNINAVGARIFQFENKKIRVYENNPAKGFLSSMMIPIHIGISGIKPDSTFLVWPDNTYQKINIGNDSLQSYNYQTGLPQFDFSIITDFYKSNIPPVEDITNKSGIEYFHHENPFGEFNREPLLPHMISTEGPALAVADINNDGLDDIFIGSTKGYKSAVFIQKKNGSFEKTIQPDLDADSLYEDVDAVWIDVNNDHWKDLVIASGGNEYFGTDIHQVPRVYMNEQGHGFRKKDNAFPEIYMTASCIVPNDFNGDGFIDLFLGGRTIPWNYGEIPRSYLLQNDGSGKFTDVTQSTAKDLQNAGMVTNATWCDINKDNKKDLLICYEWGGIDAFIYSNGVFDKKTITDKKGWWNFILPFDADNDGDLDLIAGNLGLNSRLKGSPEKPVKLYYNDFDDNGKKEQLLTYYIGDKEVPVATKDELVKQIPVLKKKYFYAEDFAKSTLDKIFSKEKLNSSLTYEANYFSNALLINNGNFNFTVKSLPWEAQLTSYRDAVLMDVNNDNLLDIVLAGNYYDNNIHMGRNDEDYGTILVNDGNDNFRCESLPGIQLKGQTRHIRTISIGNKKALILARNNEPVTVIQFKQPGNKF